jgi:hypothetical protein
LPKSSEVQLKLLEERDPQKNVQHHFVEQRFSGRLMRVVQLPHDSAFVVAELACEPPAESLRALAGGSQVRARLQWFPPIYAHPAFAFGAVLAVAGAGAWVTVRARRRDATSSPAATSPARAINGHGSLNGAHVELGGEGALLQLVGRQLRECIARGELDGAVIAAAEWALDRHRARGVRLIAEGLEEDSQLEELLKGFIEECELLWEGNTLLARETLRRFSRVLRVVTKETLQQQVRRLERLVEGEDLPTHRRNGDQSPLRPAAGRPNVANGH